jgi:hypothetical protein
MKTLKDLFLTLLLALPLAAGAAQRPATPFTDAELDALLAPIALYPDTVLSHVLIAATVPEDVEAAADWAERHPNLEGQAAVDAVERKDWDPSVKALVAFPEVLDRMVEDPDWTDDLGLAFLEQEADVMDRVQYLRDRAYENGALDRIEHVRVVREREYIYLEPAVRTVYYVPYYDPWYVYGSWWWPAYPPHRWHYWAGYPVNHYHGSTFYWGISYHVGPSFYASSFNWRHRHVVVAREHRYYTPQGYSGRSSMRRPNVAVNDSRRYHGSSSWRQGSPASGTRPPRPDRPAHPTRPTRPTHPTHPAHPDHPDHPEHPAHPSRPGRSDLASRGNGARQAASERGQRRSWTDVRAQLAARRSGARSDDVAPRGEGAGRSNETPRGNAHGRTEVEPRGSSLRRSDEARVSEHRGDSRRSGTVREPVERRNVEAPQPRQEHADRDAPSRDNGQGRARVERAPQARSDSRSENRSENRNESRSESRNEGRGESHGNGNGGGSRGQPNGQGRGQQRSQR